MIARVTSSKMSRYGIMAIQLLAMLTTIHHPLKCGIVVYLVNLRHLFHSIPLDECFVYQLGRCSYLSLHELILNTPSSRRSFSVESPYVVIVLDEDLASKDVKIHFNQWINIFEKGNCIMKTVLACVSLSSYLTSWISGRDSCLVGVSCHSPSFTLALD